jgi:MFS-type transporter involved in bile tolerance (Atg22 family)
MKRVSLFFIACFLLLSCTEGERIDGSPKDLVNISIIEGYTHAKISSGERSLLAHLLPKNEEGALRSLILLKGDDRMAAVWWEARVGAERLFGCKL